eukprot:scaffold49608_cov69-Phaeocystis_antarctica.AAC.2
MQRGRVRCGRAAYEIESEVDGGPARDDQHGERQAEAAVVVVFRAHVETAMRSKRVLRSPRLPNGAHICVQQQ